jgi:DNA-binding GntR family transcriptional regulator
VSLGDAERVETTTDRVVKQLSEAILAGSIRQGIPVREEEWARRLGVSRTPVREALFQLVAANVLRKEGRSVFLFQPSLAEIVEVYEIRRALEPLAARSALRRCDSETAAGLAKRLEPIRIQKASDQLSIPDHDAFHMFLYEASGKSRLTTMIASLRALSEPYIRFATSVDPEFRKLSYRQHKEMVEAFKARDEDRLVGAIEAHLDLTCDRVRALIDAGWAGTPS